jgi:hypothetical protein
MYSDPGKPFIAPQYHDELRSPLRLALVASVLFGCTSEGTVKRADDIQRNPSGSGELVFDAPQGIAVHRRWVLVANTAFDHNRSAERWAPGYITVIDRENRRVVSTIPTTQLNPVEIAIAGDVAYVVNSGTFELGATGVATTTSAGGIDVIDLDSFDPPTSVSENIPLAQQERDPRIGGYGSIAIDTAARWAYLGSGTRGDVFQLDLRTRELVHGPDAPLEIIPTPAGENGLTVVRRLGSALAVLDFNRDMLCTSDDWEHGLADRRCEPIGVSEELLEGPIDLAEDDQGRALVLMSIANSIYRIDVRQTPFKIDHDFVSTGLAVNRIAVRDRSAYLVNSSSNNLQRVDLESRAWDLPFTAFTPGANPYALALADEVEGAVAWVTLFGRNQVAVVSLATGKVLDRIGPRATLASPTARGEQASACEQSDRALVGVSNIVSLAYGPGAGQGQQSVPELIRGGPNGSGDQSGAVDGVLSLGTGGTIVVDFGDYDLVDEPGPDFVVFENPFLTAPRRPFAEPAIVGVAVSESSADAFIDFPCAWEMGADQITESAWPHRGCAGVHPVYANMETNCIDPTDWERAGGDAFDLADVGLARARYLRIRDAGVSLIGNTTRGFDLDAVVAIHAERR